MPIVSLSFAAFVFNTTEFVPVGLLTAIAANFSMSYESAGWLITIYAWTVALLSLPLTIFATGIDRRTLLLWLFGIFIASHLLAAFAWSFESLMAARIGIACAHAVFWAITIPLAVRLKPNESGKAIALVVAGSSMAAMMGIPIGTLIGQWFGWRTTFAVIGVIALAVALVLRYLLPPLPEARRGASAEDRAFFARIGTVAKEEILRLPHLLSRPAVVWVYLLTMVFVTGEFAAYTYIGPFLEARGFTKDAVAWILLVMGGAGLFGSYLFGKFEAAHPNRILIVSMIIVAASLVLMRLGAAHGQTFVVLAFIWGTAAVMIFMSLQSRLIRAASDNADNATAIYSGIFNIGIGGGSFVGALVSARLGIELVGYFGAAIVLTALALATLYLKQTRGQL
ncbi:putative sugar efflux transporter [Campylobacterota bacterium]|nr:putative sugar efflux transporter [Campylobacterota bacterium]